MVADPQADREASVVARFVFDPCGGQSVAAKNAPLLPGCRLVARTASQTAVGELMSASTRNAPTAIAGGAAHTLPRAVSEAAKGYQAWMTSKEWVVLAGSGRRVGHGRRVVHP